MLLWRTPLWGRKSDFFTVATRPGQLGRASVSLISGPCGLERLSREFYRLRRSFVGAEQQVNSELIERRIHVSSSRMTIRAKVGCLVQSKEELPSEAEIGEGPTFNPPLVEAYPVRHLAVALFPTLKTTSPQEETSRR